MIFYTGGCLNTGVLVHTGAFTQRCFSQRHVFHTNVCTYKCSYPEKLLHKKHSRTGAFTQACFYTEELLQTVTQDHAGTSTHRCLYTGMLLRRNAFKHVLLHRGSFDAEYAVHTEAFPYAHTNTLTQKDLRTKIHSYSCDFLSTDRPQILIQRGVLAKVLSRRER